MSWFLRWVDMDLVGKSKVIAAIGRNDANFCALIDGKRVEHRPSLQVETVEGLATASHVPSVAVASDRGDVRVVDIASDRLLFSRRVGTCAMDLALDADAQTLGVVQRERDTQLSHLFTIDLKTNKRRRLAHGDLEGGVCHAKGCFWTSIKTGRKYDLVSFDESGKRGEVIALGGQPTHLTRALSADVIVTGIGKRSVARVDVSTGRVSRIVTHDQKGANDAVIVAVSPDGSRVVAWGNGDETLVATEGEETHRLTPLTGVQEPHLGGTLITRTGFVTDGSQVITFDGTRVNRLSLS